MKRKIITTFSVITVALACVLIGWPRIQDHRRDEAYREMKKHGLARPEQSAWQVFSETEDSGDWRQTGGQFGVNLISGYREEAYRVTILRMVKSGVITVVLGEAPYWEEVLPNNGGIRRGALSRSAVEKIRAIVARCHFWEIDGYWSWHGTDGEDWYIEGSCAGRYRRIAEYCPNSNSHGSYVYAIGREIAEAIDSDLTEP